jgi:sarcosine oxidase
VDADFGVVGLGAMGSAALWRLAVRDVSVLGLEQFRPGHPFGSSHGLSRIYRLAALEGPQYVPLGRLAVDLWRQLERDSGTMLLTTTGGLMIGPPDCDAVAGTLRSARQHDLPHEILTAGELRRRFPQHVISDDSDMAVLDPAAGVLRPESGITAAVRRAESGGARVVRNVRVTGIEPDADGVTVHTGARPFRFGEVVLATGAWTAKLLSGPGLRHHVRRVVMSWFEPRAGMAPQFSPGAFPIFVRSVPEGGTWGVPAIDGSLVKVGPEAYPERDDDPDDIDRAVYPQDTSGVSAFVARYLPGLDPEPVKVQPCMIAESQDGHFILGRPEGLPHIVLAVGMCGHGFKYASAVGEIAASLATDTPPAVPVEPFSPDRLIAAARPAVT